MSRRSFLKFSAAMTTVLALPVTYAPRVARAVEAAPHLPLVWLRGQACSGNGEAFLQATSPSVSELILEVLSVDYHEALMAPSGDAATQSRSVTMALHPGGYVAVVEGAVPTDDDGVACMVGGRPFRDVAREVCEGAAFTIAVGSCAFDGGLPAAAGGSTGAAGAGAVAPGGRLVSLPGCPLNVDNLTATIVHYLATGELPPTDRLGRPLFAYGALVHNQCERRAQFEFGQFVQAWGDEGAQKGWCLYRMGCKGPETYANCPTAKYADDASWPVRAGHGCVGCTMPGFWDSMSPFYRRLPSPLPFAREVTTDQVGQVVLGGVGAVVGVHAVATVARSRLARRPPGRGPALEEPSMPADEGTAAGAAAPAAIDAPAATEPAVEAETAGAAGPADETRTPAAPAGEVEAPAGEVEAPAEEVVALAAADDARPDDPGEDEPR